MPLAEDKNMIQTVVPHADSGWSHLHWIIVHFIERGACHVAPRRSPQRSGARPDLAPQRLRTTSAAAQRPPVRRTNSRDGRDRALDGGRQEVEPLRPSGRDYDPDRLSPRLAGVRVVRSAMVAG